MPAAVDSDHSVSLWLISRHRLKHQQVFVQVLLPGACSACVQALLCEPLALQLPIQ